MDSRVADGIYRFEERRHPVWPRSFSVLWSLIWSVRAEACRGVVLVYLRQEGLTDGVPWGLVDLGWNGRLQSSLKSLIGPELRHPIKGFYFALIKRPTGVGELEAYFSDRQAGLGLVRSPLHASIMEMFCTAPHGRTIGYEERGGRVEPVFAAADSRLLEWGVDIVHRATLEFARHVAQSAGNCSPHSDLRQMISELIRVWWTLPDRRHARAWGDFPYEDDQAGGMRDTVAAPFSWADCARACLRRGCWWPRSRIEWCQASLVLTSAEKLMLARTVNQTWKALGPLRKAIRRIVPRH